MLVNLFTSTHAPLYPTEIIDPRNQDAMLDSTTRQMGSNLGHDG